MSSRACVYVHVRGQGGVEGEVVDLIYPNPTMCWCCDTVTLMREEVQCRTLTLKGTDSV